jgi:hypothetical protein
MKYLTSGLLAGCAALALGGVSPTVNAATYTYTGNTFTSVSAPYTTSDSVTGSITLSTPLAANLSSFTTVVPTAFSFTSAGETIANTTPGSGSQFFFKTDSAGNITYWGATVYVGSVSQFSISTINAPATYGVFDSIQHGGGTEEGLVSKAPGTWTLAAAVPEPDSTALLFAGMTLVGFAATRRKAP